MLFALPWAGALIALYLTAAEKAGARDWKGCAMYALGLCVMSGAWLAIMGYFGYRAYLAIP